MCKKSKVDFFYTKQLTKTKQKSRIVFVELTKRKLNKLKGDE